MGVRLGEAWGLGASFRCRSSRTTCGGPGGGPRRGRITRWLHQTDWLAYIHPMSQRPAVNLSGAGDSDSSIVPPVWRRGSSWLVAQPFRAMELPNALAGLVGPAGLVGLVGLAGPVGLEALAGLQGLQAAAGGGEAGGTPLRTVSS